MGVAVITKYQNVTTGISIEYLSTIPPEKHVSVDGSYYYRTWSFSKPHDYALISAASPTWYSGSNPKFGGPLVLLIKGIKYQHIGVLQNNNWVDDGNSLLATTGLTVYSTNYVNAVFGL